MLGGTPAKPLKIRVFFFQTYLLFKKLLGADGNVLLTVQGIYCMPSGYKISDGML